MDSASWRGADVPQRPKVCSNGGLRTIKTIFWGLGIVVINLIFWHLHSCSYCILYISQTVSTFLRGRVLKPQSSLLLFLHLKLCFSSSHTLVSLFMPKKGNETLNCSLMRPDNTNRPSGCRVTMTSMAFVECSSFLGMCCRPFWKQLYFFTA